MRLVPRTNSAAEADLPLLHRDASTALSLAVLYDVISNIIAGLGVAVVVVVVLRLLWKFRSVNQRQTL